MGHRLVSFCLPPLAMLALSAPARADDAQGLAAPRPAAGATVTPPPADALVPAPAAEPPAADAVVPAPAPAPDASAIPPAPVVLRPGPTAGYDAVFADRETNGELPVSSRLSARLRVLDNDLSALASRGGSSVADGVLSLVTGGLITGLGIVADDPVVSPYFYVYGTATVAQGVIELAVVPDPSEPAIAFAHMPMATAEDARLRLAFGEESLQNIAEGMRLARLLDSGVSIGAGLAVIPIYLGPNDYKIVEPMDYFVVIGSAFAVISGVINLLSRTDAERRWAAYSDLRDRLEARGP